MTSDKLTPTDSRVQHKTTTLNGQEYHYLLAEPASKPRATIFLIHGFPDMSFAWRYQIPTLVSLNLRVVVPDMMGYGLTAAPESLEYYTLKRAADDMAALAKELDAPEIIVLGHDWGGAVVYRIAMWHPQLVSAVISICTPFFVPQKQYIPVEEMVKFVPNFKYQVQLAGPDVQQKIQGKEKIRQFLNGIYGGWEEGGKVGFTTQKGVIFDNLPALQQTKLLSREELDYYAEIFSRNGLRGPLNWYRTRELNSKDERELAEDKIKVPTLFVQATNDNALPPSMSQGMDKYFNDLRIKQVEASHWALWQKPEDCNALIKEFLEELLASKGGAML